MPGELGKVFVWRMKLTPPRETKEKKKTKTPMQFYFAFPRDVNYRR